MFERCTEKARRVVFLRGLRRANIPASSGTDARELSFNEQHNWLWNFSRWNPERPEAVLASVLSGERCGHRPNIQVRIAK